MKRVICIGNRYDPEDSAGPAVYDCLKEQQRQKHRENIHDMDGMEVIDGGLLGIDLLRFVEKAERVVFVDRVYGFCGPDNINNIVVLEAKDILAAVDGADGTDAAAIADSGGQYGKYDHSAGLPYLLRMVPQVCDGPAPRMVLVGIEGNPEKNFIEKAAAIALEVVRGKGDFDRENQND